MLAFALIVLSALAVGAAGPGPAPQPAPASARTTAHLASDLVAPLVLLEPNKPKGETGPASNEDLISGVAISTTRVVISLSTLRRLGAPQLRNARASGGQPTQVTTSFEFVDALHQRYWSVTGWDGKTRRGEYILSDAGLGIGIIELETPLPSLGSVERRALSKTSEGREKPSEMRVQIVGLESFDGRVAFTTLDSTLYVLDDKHGFFTTVLPETFDGSLGLDRAKRPLGIVIGTSTSGAAELVTFDALEDGMARAVAHDRSAEVRWSAGLRFGRTFLYDHPASLSLGGSLDFIVNRRWGLTAEASWQQFQKTVAVEGSPYTRLDSDTDLWIATGLARVYLGPPASSYRVGLGLGAAARIESTRELTTILHAEPDCVADEECPISGAETSSRGVTAYPAPVFGLEFASFRNGPAKTLAGIRVGYRFVAIIPNMKESLHTLFLGFQI